MNPQIITTIAADLGVLVALWTIMSNFDKRNGDRFTALVKEIQSVKETLRAELKLEVREAGDRRVVQK